MVGGVTVNFILALFIYSMIMFHWGESYVRVADMSQGMKFNKEAKSYGFKDHDILLTPTYARSRTSVATCSVIYPRLSIAT